MTARSNRLAQRGFSYFEVLLSVVLLGVLLVPAIEGLQSGLLASQNPVTIGRQWQLTDKMEQVLARPFVQLYAYTFPNSNNTTTSVNAALSDPAGTPDRRLVLLYRYDASTKALSNNDTGLLFVRVYYEAEPANAVTTLMGRWW